MLVLALTALLPGPAKHQVPTAVLLQHLMQILHLYSNMRMCNVCQQACCQGQTAWHFHKVCVTHQSTRDPSNIPGDVVLGHNLEGLLQIHVRLQSIAITGRSLALHVIPATSLRCCSLLWLCTLPLTCSASIHQNAMMCRAVQSQPRCTFKALLLVCTLVCYTMWAFMKTIQDHSPMSAWSTPITAPMQFLSYATQAEYAE